MIINLNKFQKTNKLTIDLTDKESCIYFLLYVDEKTPRYKRVNGQFYPDPKGNYVIDHGIDIFNNIPRVLKYIGETIYFSRRISEHYKPQNRTRSGSGIGPIFNYVRYISGFKRFKYDTVRIHTETTLVRKYLPEINQAAQLTEQQKLIILNSKGKVSPWDLIKPYKLHARDIYRASEAWKNEDQEYFKKEFVEFKIKNHVGLVHPNKRNPISYYNKNGKKYSFSYFVWNVVCSYHIKQVEAANDFYKRKRAYIKEYDTDGYEKIILRDRKYNTINYAKNKEFILKSDKLRTILKKKNKQQPILI
jgi:hypothetical protein